MQPHPIKVYFGFLTAVAGVSGNETNCDALLVSAQGHASWNPSDVARVTTLAVSNMPACGVQVKAPLVGEPCEIWYMPDGAAKVYLKHIEIVFQDCPATP